MSAGNDYAATLASAVEKIDANTKALRDVIELFHLAPQSAKTYETFTLPLSLNQPVILLSMDASRTRALIRASTPEVFVGRLSTLSGSGTQGYPLPTDAGDEFKNIDELYVVYNPSGTPATEPFVSVLVERNTK